MCKNYLIMTEFVNNYDCVGWVPTIKGCFSVNPISTLGEFTYGDFDKCSIVLTDIKDNQLEKHYFLATSVVKTRDRKRGIKYNRLYRCIFIGVVGEEHSNSEKEAIFPKDVCYGKLLIYFVDENSDYNELESEFLSKLDDFESFVKKNKTEIQNSSYNESSEILVQCIDKWRYLKDIVDKLALVCHKRKPNFLEKTINKIKDEICFTKIIYDVALHRDGFVFIKKTPNCDKSDIELSRDYHMAFMFIKRVFHYDYHHTHSHDDLLQVFPCSNGMFDFYKKQLSLLLDVVVDAKRLLKTAVNVEPKGIVLYAKSFITICSRRRIISNDEEKQQCKLVDNLYEELNIHNESKQKIFRNWFLDKDIYEVKVIGIVPIMIGIVTLLSFYGALFKKTSSAILLFGKEIMLWVVKNLTKDELIINFFSENYSFIIVNLFLIFCYLLFLRKAKNKIIRQSKNFKRQKYNKSTIDKYKSKCCDNGKKYRMNYRYKLLYMLENIFYELLGPSDKPRVYYKYLLEFCVIIICSILIVVSMLCLLFN